MLRPRLWAALLGAVASAVLAAPGYADPVPRNPAPGPQAGNAPAANAAVRLPDSGARPVANGVFQLPGELAGNAAPGASPVPAGGADLGTRVSLAQQELLRLGQEVTRLRQADSVARAQLLEAEQTRQFTQQELDRAQAATDTAAADALKEAAALPPGALSSDLYKLSLLNRVQRGQTDGTDADSAARELARARKAAQAAEAGLLSAQNRARITAEELAAAEQAYQDQQATVNRLVEQQRLAQSIPAARSGAAAIPGVGALPGENGVIVSGGQAHPRALAAVRYALAQLGDPYVWAAEGPDAFDCSGLMWAAYRTAGADYFGLPRVANDQYYATRHRTVAPSALLPGDLVFFASNSSWTSIHHVGMYIGEGKMVHAPTFGDVVRIAPVDTSRIYAATRIFGAVDEKDPKPEKPKPTKPKPKPKPTPTKPSPEPTKPADPSPEPSDPSTPTPTPSDPTPSDPPSPTPGSGSGETPEPGDGDTPSPTPGDESGTSPEPTVSSSALPADPAGKTDGA